MNKQTTETKKVDKLNVSSIEDRLSKVDISKVEKKNKDKLYINVPTDSDKAKSFRGKQRRTLKNHRNAIIINAKTKKNKELKESIKSFKAFYKSEYRTNDFEVSSIYQGSNKENTEDLNLMFDIIKNQK